MTGSVSKTILVGHLGKDPEVRTGPSGARVATLSLATSESGATRPPASARSAPSGTGW